MHYKPHTGGRDLANASKELSAHLKSVIAWIYLKADKKWQLCLVDANWLAEQEVVGAGACVDRGGPAPQPPL